MAFRRRFRRRGSRSTWGYADAELLQLTGGGASPPISYMWLLPPGRVNYLMDTDRVSHMGFRGCHMWLDFSWSNNGAAQFMPDVTMYAIVTQQNATSQAPDELMLNPWAPPNVPSAIASWTVWDDDGTSPFLWCHHIKGESPPNAVVNNNGTTGNNNNDRGANQYDIINTGTTDNLTKVCRKFFVAAEWQPDVIIKSRRRLVKDDGIALIMRTDSTFGSSQQVNLGVRVRTLLSRGR